MQKNYEQLLNPFEWFDCIIKQMLPLILEVGGAVASWLVRLTLEQAVRVQAGDVELCCVLGQDT